MDLLGNSYRTELANRADCAETVQDYLILNHKQMEPTDLESETAIPPPPQIDEILPKSTVSFYLGTREVTGCQPQLALDSTLQELTLFNVSIESKRPAREIVNLFNDNPLLPGVIITTEGKFVGMISRRCLFERMSRPYSWEFFSKRPILALYQLAKPNLLLLPSDTSIGAAARESLERSPELIYEPIVVQNPQGAYHLLDVHQLLLAQCQVHDAAAAALRKQTTELETTLSELQQTQAQLVQTEKMSSLGQLVAGVAHELNNPINCIYSNLPYTRQYTKDLLNLLQLYIQQSPHPSDEIKAAQKEIDLEFLIEDLPRILSAMDQGADRIMEIARSLRNFSRLDEAQMKPANLHEGIDSTLLILHHRLKPKKGFPGIQIMKEYGNLPPVECYAGQLNQVFMNLLGNGIDALEEQSSQGYSPSQNPKYKIQNPQIRIQTETLDDNWVRIRIADNGPGMTEGVRERLFDPFFTTKPTGKGTGLGLSISYKIVVEKHDGQLKCISAPGQGSEFVIEIPIRHSP
jgi:signal transduction histidine kinase